MHGCTIEVNLFNPLAKMKGHPQVLCSRKQRLLEIDTVQVHKRRVIFGPDIFVERSFMS
jgi:hypothetical protein